MITYVVTIFIKKDVEQDWVSWMRNQHLPDVMSTGCFTERRFGKIVNGNNKEEYSEYLIQYMCRTMSDYNRYQDDFAPKLQKEHTERYSGQFEASRQLLKLKSEKHCVQEKVEFF